MRSSCRVSYTDLPPNGIRLLHINLELSYPAAGELVVVPLEEAPLYYALSHCWGHQDQRTDIIIGGAHISILTALHLGIQRLRALAASTTAHWALDPPLNYVWIDSICINQQDAQERSAQVQLMGAIYSRAIRTLIWLGPEFSSSSVAWGMVDNIFHVFREETPAAQTLEDIPLCVYSDAVHAGFGLPSWDSPMWSYLKQLFDLRWFSRIWVIQEVVQSSQDPIIIHGQTLYSWQRLGWAATWLRRKGYTRLPQISQAILNVDTLCILRRSRTAWPLEALLSITQVKFHATDQRDKVWSLLGLAAECWSTRTRETKAIRSVESIPHELRPDYTLSTKQVYQRVGRYLLTHSHSIALFTRTRGLIGSLSRTQRTTELPGLPSWVPDWSDFEGYNRHIRTSFSWVHYAPGQEQEQPAILGYPNNYAAAAQTRLRVYNHEEAPDADGSMTKSHNGSILRVGGIVVTQIERVVLLNGTSTCREQFHASFDCTMVLIIQTALILLDQITQRWVADLVRVTTADQHNSSGYTWEQCLHYGSRYLRNLVISCRKDILSFPRLSSATRAHDTLLDILLANLLSGLKDIVDQQAEAAYVALARNFCFNRTFLITTDGKMGLGPSAAQSGDTVAVISGGGVPFVLRSQQGPHLQAQDRVDREKEINGQESLQCYWHVVGESYIQGLMNGEAVEASQQGIVKEQLLALI
ncbi:uncharacterized protein PG986_004587 [Apiospora aurea]|uniref:Heterokaryon incompatibility domain-containing protein n=1 Tax=Apiospora aurea TaxID=335848 RepID=A0ABR1QN03_9PEZI